MLNRRDLIGSLCLSASGSDQPQQLARLIEAPSDLQQNELRRNVCRGCGRESLQFGKEHPMAANTDADANTDNLVGVPEPDPPQADPKVPDPADMAPGLGGTSVTRPHSTSEDDDR